METRSVVIGIVVAVVVGAGVAGVATAFDRLVGPDPPEVSVERINESHAAVSWTTDRPTRGTLSTLTQHRCNGSWVGVNTINDSSRSRTHLVVAPIYELNRSHVNRTRASLPNDSYAKQYMQAPPKRYEVTVTVHGDGSAASKTVFKRTLSRACG
ncbi:hypothetical protein [Halococcus sp. AFM35]|uniref:hypothetical protein n=1 Tax=Halococcus sp. AFM35 TaxID=3421653 RepID=UPI003EBBFCBE